MAKIIRSIIFSTILGAVLVAGSLSDNSKIINGIQVGSFHLDSNALINPHEFPYLVNIKSLLHRKFGSFDFKAEKICGGAIIDHDVILTAAHCVSGVDPENIKIRAGAVHLNLNGKETVEVVARAYKIHENYHKPSTHDNDIAIVWTKEPLSFNKFIKRIPLPMFIDRGMFGKKAKFAGWGWDESGEFTEFLHKTRLTIITNEKCQNSTEFTITENMMCAIGLRDDDGNGAGALAESVGCQGDSGGPLVYKNTLVGLYFWNMDNDRTAEGKVTCKKGLPGVFIKVARYLLWINEHINQEKEVKV